MLFEPWKYKKGTPERAGIWENVAESLEQVDAPYFRVDKRAVRDRYNKLVKEHKKKRRQEEKASGIAPEHDEADDALDNIVDLLEQFEKEHQIETDKEKRKTEEEQGKAVEMRQRSLETFSETKKRNDDEPKSKRPRSTGSDTMKYLQERVNKDYLVRQEELKLRKEEQGKELSLKEKELNLKVAQQDLFRKEMEER